MAQNVVVLAPNGRRQAVKVTPNTTILQILEEVCSKQGINSQEYDLKHHNKVLDTTTLIRFSGLPNNAQLEIASAKKLREETEVLVALNMEDGTRVTGNFIPSNTLFEVLTRLVKEVYQNPVIIYTRREIYGDDLRNTNLRSLGLTGGRAMLRLVNRIPEDLKQQANVSAPIMAKPVEEQPYKRVFKPIEEPPRTAAAPVETKNTETSAPPPPKNKKSQQIPGQVDILKMAKELKKKDALKSEKSENKPEPMDVDKKSPSPPPPKTVPQKSAPPSAVPSTKSAKTKGEPQKVKIDEFAFIGERNAMIFSLETAQAIPSEDLPEDFFELTIDDARKILKDIRQKREDLEVGGPLLTSALRELEESKKQIRNLNKYTKAIMRIIFPDRTVLQATFLPTDTVQEVMTFVKQYLADANTQFYLYTTPPKSVLQKEKRLIEVDCVPGASVHFGGPDPLRKDYLKPELKNKFTTNSLASLAALQMRQQATRTGTSISEEPTAGSSKQPDTGSSKQPMSNSEKPKWFKSNK